MRKFGLPTLFRVYAKDDAHHGTFGESEWYYISIEADGPHRFQMQCKFSKKPDEKEEKKMVEER
jgi:hypothetical protein